MAKTERKVSQHLFRCPCCRGALVLQVEIDQEDDGWRLVTTNTYRIFTPEQAADAPKEES